MSLCDGMEITMKIPISLIIDDPTPVVNPFYLSAKSGTTSYEHARLRLETKDGRPLVKRFSKKLFLMFLRKSLITY